MEYDPYVSAMPVRERRFEMEGHGKASSPFVVKAPWCSVTSALCTHRTPLHSSTLLRLPFPALPLSSRRMTVHRGWLDPGSDEKVALMESSPVSTAGEQAYATGLPFSRRRWQRCVVLAKAAYERADRLRRTSSGRRGCQRSLCAPCLAHAAPHGRHPRRTG